MADQPRTEDAMDQAIGRFDRMVRDPNRTTSLLGAVAVGWGVKRFIGDRRSTGRP